MNEAGMVWGGEVDRVRREGRWRVVDGHGLLRGFL